MNLIWHNNTPVQFPRKFENKDTHLRMEGVSELDYELCYCLDIAVIRIQTKPGHLVQ